MRVTVSVKKRRAKRPCGNLKDSPISLLQSAGKMEKGTLGEKYGLSSPNPLLWIA